MTLINGLGIIFISAQEPAGRHHQPSSTVQFNHEKRLKFRAFRAYLEFCFADAAPLRSIHPVARILWPRGAQHQQLQQRRQQHER